MNYICIRQHDGRDCGAACLSTICAHYGLKLPLFRYKELTKTDNDGTNIYGIIDAATKLGFSSRALVGNLQELLEGIHNKEIQTPFISHIITEEMFVHYVVIYKIKNERLIVGDPAKGIKKYTLDEFESVWSGNIITFSLTDEFQKRKEKQNLLFLFLNIVSGQKKLVFSVISCSIIIACIGIFSAFAFQYIIDFLTTSGDNNSIDFFGLFLNRFIHNSAEDNNIPYMLMGACVTVIILYCIEALLKIIRGYLIPHFSNKLDISIMLGHHNKIVDLPMRFFGTIKTGEIMSRFSDAVKIRDAISSVLFSASMDSIMVIFGSIILYKISSKLFIWILLLSATYIIIIFIYKNRIRSIEQKIMESNSQMTSYLKESIDGIETIKSFRSEEKVKLKTKDTFSIMIKYIFKGNVMDNNRSTISALISSLGTIVLFWIGVLEVARGTLTLGTLITFNALSVYFLNPFVNLIGLQSEIQTALVATERLNDIMGLEQEELSAGLRLPNLKKDITLKNVNFRYGNRHLVLNNISFSIKKGQKIGIVGESGSGKTSLAKLLLALYEPEAGNIFFDNTEMRQLNKEFLRDRISYLPQELFFFADSVMNNLKLGNKEATISEINEVCKKCAIHDYIKSLPSQYDTLLEENGRNLSGGQKQMLAMARALLKKPDILILDEATSNLDSITESIIEKVIFELTKEEITCIIIAHRLRTIVDCDKILVMEKGIIIESGTHKELLDNKNKYYTYWKEQMQTRI